MTDIIVLLPHWQDAIGNITAINMISTIVVPLLEDVTDMLLSTQRQDPSVCSPVPPAVCNDNWGRADCCATRFTGATYPNASQWQVRQGVVPLFLHAAAAS
jgi:hypothetical protein